VKTTKIQSPLTEEAVRALRSGDKVFITGTIYTARDAAHMRMIESIEGNEPLPFDMEGQIIYYVGPSPEQPGAVIGACGPTTSYRMDDLTLPLLERGLRGMIGKGERSVEVIEGLKKFGAVYFAAIGGAGALLASSVVSSEVIAYSELGAEAVRKLEVVDFPAIVAIDAQGHNVYETERERFKKT
jgi:fumarate hydratase subunit beta